MSEFITNAELRIEAERLCDDNEHLREENAKLRELATSMYDYVTKREMELCNACTEADGEYASCEACDDYDGACGIAKKRFEELYDGRMRELGIEVSK